MYKIDIASVLKVSLFILFLFISELGHCQAEKKTSNRQAYLDAAMLKAMGNYEEAAAKCREFLSEEQDDVRFRHYAFGLLGECLAGLGKNSEAIPYLSRYIKYVDGDNIIQ